MTWLEALDKLGDHPGADSWRRLTAEDYPDTWARDGYRRHVITLAGGESEPAEYPSLMTQAASAIGAAVGFMASGFAMVDQAEQDRRLKICWGCEHYSNGRCALCGCVARWKARIANESCPDNPPRWGVNRGPVPSLRG